MVKWRKYMTKIQAKCSYNNNITAYHRTKWKTKLSNFFNYPTRALFQYRYAARNESEL